MTVQFNLKLFNPKELKIIMKKNQHLQFKRNMIIKKMIQVLIHYLDLIPNRKRNLLKENQRKKYKDELKMEFKMKKIINI
jgi:hypothetical protein